MQTDDVALTGAAPPNRDEALHLLHLSEEAVSYTEAVRSTQFSMKKGAQVCQ